MQVNKTLINTQTFCYIIFSIGIIGSVALIIGAMVAIAYILDKAVIFLCQTVASITSLYHHADSLVQLIILCILAFIAYKLVCLFIHSVKREVARW
jgi:hypothetical protein